MLMLEPWFYFRVAHVDVRTMVLFRVAHVDVRAMVLFQGC